MNLSSILSDNTPPPSMVSLASAPAGHEAPIEGSAKQMPPSLNVTLHTSRNGSSVKNANGRSLHDLPYASASMDKDYLARFEANINAINTLDEALVSTSKEVTLQHEKHHLHTLLKATGDTANNYANRLTTEALLCDSKTPPAPSSSWGSTRYTAPQDAVEARRAALEENARRFSSVVTPEPELKEPAKAKTSRKRSGEEIASEKKRKTEDSVDKGSRARDAKENGRIKIKQSLKEVNPDGKAASNGPDDEKGSPQKAKELKSVTKQYDNTFVAIWKDLSRKDGPKVSRLMQQSNQAKLINLRKTAILAAREAKRWQLKNNKNQKDLTSKARRAMREMFNFWKRTDRLERDRRKKEEKELIDKAKREEEEREAKRQSRKLDFLITQTELYSHFIGKKIKTDEIEGTDADPNLQNDERKRDWDKYHGVKGESHDFRQLDFDQDDEDALHRAAAANAQSALDVAKSRAQAFNDDEFRNPDTNGEEMNFQNPTLIGDMSITQPEMLKCTLKEYQVKGLNWLANLYEQGINGILADEMGLGKTVQSISVLAYLAETHNIWGPYLVVTPASTLHNWQQEITKFVPGFKVLPYWGNAKDRKILRKFWDRKSLRYDKDAPFHVLVTSYQLVVADAPYFQKMKWQYMILDEAQAIKSSSSSRWKSLLSFSCRNRLLLTGTPIQNSMQELWALLHFIMPSLFDSHDEFSDWFSKDIESHAQSNTQLNEQQLKRLHVILKPFMLRRVKKNVQSELGDKVEIDLFCDLTNRQQKYYQMLKSQISIMDLLDASNNTDESTQSLMNLVMQFRKVCNHPDLFERADVRSSFSFGSFAETSSFLRETDLELAYTTRNSIQYGLPKLVYHDLLVPNENSNKGSKEKIYDMFSIYKPDNVIDDELDNFGFLKFVNTSPQELYQLSKADLLRRAIALKDYSGAFLEKVNRLTYAYDDDDFIPQSKRLLIREQNEKLCDINNSVHLKKLYSIRDIVYEDMYINVLPPAAEPNVAATPIEMDCSNMSFNHMKQDILFDQSIRSSLAPMTLNEEYDLMKRKIPVPEYPKSNMLPEPVNKFIDYSNIRMPSMNRFITESGKLSMLDKLLDNLKNNDHRVLIYFQMTKMMDLMEEYLTFRQHKYIRLDGSSKLEDRRDLVHDWQTKPEIFVFLLSTRAGGLGINLTAADTVVFYDSDWNPTIDSQAMDRAHRLGQTKQVTVYRLLTKGTIEERMRDRAKQKEQVQQVVMEGKASFGKKKEDAATKKKDVAFLLLGGEENPAETNTPSDGTSTNTGDSTPSVEPMSKTLEAMYHEGEGQFSGTITPMS
ncbi:hypothetical_protein [Candidozyma auris]|uniref:chromatin-remodeling ATPase INO80 n=1 Tax=Candidozyma auris TaxID=498019 RepID=UPI000D2B6210|nr:chromatin-remodeling ATPase INO80 [[Candida] auris]QEO21794.1 hypothetical_protein [[Candida] auris]GBL51788.1 putative helicase [[Candida] auris]